MRQRSGRRCRARACDNPAMRPILLALTLVAAPLFAQDEAKPNSAPKKDLHRLNPDHERTPFSAAEIRDGCQPGRVTIFRIENAAGQKALQAFRFLEANDEGAVFEVAMFSPDGKRQLNQSKNTSTWVGFQSHASFPKEQTTRSESKVKTPAGTFDCWQYLVLEKVQGNTAEKRYYFAKKLAGPPVKMTIHVEGKRQFEMMMVEYRDGTESARLKAMGFKGVAGASDAQKEEYAAAFVKREDREGTVADAVKRQVHKAEAPVIFKALDKDGDGQLTREELAAGAGTRDAKVIAELFWRLDHNADGAVTREEFLKVTSGWVL